MVRIALFTLLLCLPRGVSATTEENEAGERLTAEATKFVDQLAGPGRAKILVTVQGEKTEVRSQTETTTPIILPKSGDAALAPGSYLPGYSPKPSEATKEAAKEPDKDPSKNWDYVQKDQEASLRQSGLIIKRIHATVILDTSLSDGLAKLIERLMPDLLRMDANRGDVLTVVQAPLLPPWRQAILGSEGMRILIQDGARALSWFVPALVLFLFVASVAYFIAMQVIRIFFAEVIRVKGAEPGAALLGREKIEELPEMLPGGVPALAEEAETVEGRPVAALGQRFDFLAEQEPVDAAAYLAKEKSEDLSLLFGYLAEANDVLATRLFAALPVSLQNEVSQSLSRLDMADPEKLAMLENRLRTATEFGIRGADRLGRILSRIPAEQRQVILGDMMSRDPAAAQKVESSMIPFESLVEVQPAELRRLLTAVPYKDWGVGLRGAPEELSKRVLELLPAEAQSVLRDYLEQPQPKDQILQARSKILSAAYELAAKGQLSLRQEDSSRLL